MLPFIKGAPADAGALIQRMEEFFAAAPFRLIGGAAIKAVREMVNPITHAGWLDFSRTGGHSYRGFLIEDGNPERWKRQKPVALILDPAGWTTIQED